MADRRKTRLDLLLVERGLTETRSLAQRLILAGRVRVEGETLIQPGKTLPPGARIELTAPPPFVSRGGEKLAGALDAFGVSPQGKVCADAGASTGEFTDSLLQRGAAKVYAVDVGKGILDWKLRNDPRVVVMEEQNVRYVAALPEKIDLLTVDVSFISLKLIFPRGARLAAGGRGSGRPRQTAVRGRTPPGREGRGGARSGRPPGGPGGGPARGRERRFFRSGVDRFSFKRTGRQYRVSGAFTVG